MPQYRQFLTVRAKRALARPVDDLEPEHVKVLLDQPDRREDALRRVRLMLFDTPAFFVVLGLVLGALSGLLGIGGLNHGMERIVDERACCRNGQEALDAASCGGRPRSVRRARPRHVGARALGSRSALRSVVPTDWSGMCRAHETEAAATNRAGLCVYRQELVAVA
ncbi:MAG: hypothetical protein IPK13_07910 [Deltaproteobacteria bacterium]|nr:hypothetical protein [Deltaproteobacteria bacterium]